MVNDLFEHVVEKLQPRVDVRFSAAIQIDGDPNVCFTGFAVDFGGTRSGSQKLPDPVPVVRNQHATVEQSLFGQ